MKEPHPDYPLEPAMSGVTTAVLVALLIVAGTLGAGLAGFWASGANPETNTNLAIMLFDDDFAALSFVNMVLGMIIGLGTKTGFVLGLAALAGLVLFLKSSSLRLEGWFGLFMAVAYSAYATAVRIYNPSGTPCWRVVLTVAVPVTAYAILRLLIWTTERSARSAHRRGG